MKNELGVYVKGIEKSQPVVVDANLASSFAAVYLKIFESIKVNNQEHPLVYYIRSLNRFVRESIPLLSAVDSSIKNGNFEGVWNTLDFEDKMKEIVERPLDYADDFNVGPYHWRRRTVAERLTLPIYDVRYKIRGEKGKQEKAQVLASFYLQSAFILYSQDNNFMQMAVADVFHSRGEKYAKSAINLVWKQYAVNHEFDVKGYHYPYGEFKPTSEYEKFMTPLFSALMWLNEPASLAWKRKRETFDLPRDIRIADLISIDRNESFIQWCSKEMAVSGSFSAVKDILSKSNIYLGREKYFCDSK